MAKKNYVLDTSVYLTDAMSIYKFDNHDIFVPLKVLEEIDGHKKRQDSVGANARQIIRILDELRSKGNLQSGVRIGKGKGLLKVMSYSCLTNSEFPPDLNIENSDHIIFAGVVTINNLIINKMNVKTSVKFIRVTNCFFRDVIFSRNTNRITNYTHVDITRN